MRKTRDCWHCESTGYCHAKPPSLLNQLQTDRIEEDDFPLVNEVAVIIGSLASEGTLTIRPLLLAHTPARLLDQVRCLTKSTLPQVPRILSTVVRSLRNVLLATIDLIWGHAYGVEMERKVVGTGLVGVMVVGGKDKAIGRESLLEAEAIEALDSIFEVGAITIDEANLSPTTWRPCCLF